MSSLPDLTWQESASTVLGGLADTALARHFQVSVSDSRGNILYANPKFCEACGYSLNELVGQNYRLLNSGLHSADLFAHMWSTLRSGLDWHGQLSNRCKNGRIVWMELTIVPISGAKGQGACYVGISSDITPLIEVKRQLQDSETMFRGLTETISAGVLLHRGGRMLYVNKALEQLTGYRRDELLNMSFAQMAHPDYRAWLLNRGEARLRGEPVPASYELPILTRDNQVRWLEVTAALVEHQDQPTVIGTFIDITERKQAEAAHHKLEGFLAQILQGDPVPTFVINERHEVSHWNRACEAITGCRAEEMIGSRRHWAAFYGKERPVMADLIVDGQLEGLDAFYQGMYRRSLVVADAYEAEGFFPLCGDGGRWLFFTAAPLRDGAGRIIGAIETLQDITERKLAEESLRQSQGALEVLVEKRTAQLGRAKAALEADIRQREASEQELRRRNGELTELNVRLQETREQLIQSEKLASIGQLAAGVAHEINNPIGYVQSNLGTLEGYVGDLFEVLEAFETVLQALPVEHQAVQAATRLMQQRDLSFLRQDLPALMNESREGISRVRKIVADLKDFSRIDSSREWQWANLHQGLDSTLNIVANEIKYKADVVREYGELPEVECLPSQLNQVFMNLLVNAGHAIQEGRGQITLRTGTAGDQVWLEVSDTGCGIAPENMTRIFDPFFTTKPVGKGTGLGLSLSYGIIQKHQGQIEVHSTLGQGSTFRITLPIRQTREGEGV